MVHIERKVAIIVAAVLGLAAVLLTNMYFRQREARYAVATKLVLVAAKEISKNSVIDYEMLAFKSIPVKFIQPGALRAKELAVGKTAVVTIMAGEQVLSTKLAAPGAGLTLATKTPPGKRAMAIIFEASSAVGGMIKPGDHVDVVASFKSPAPIILTLFQDVLVLAVGSQMVAREAAEDKGRTGTTPASGRAQKEVITLALTPQEVQILTVAQEYGKIQLTLRPRMEKGEVVPGVDLSNLPSVVDFNTLLQFYITRPTIQLPQVEIIRGLKKEVTTVPAGK